MAVAGEVSGDAHLGAVLRELRSRNASLTVWGIGGHECQAAGMEILVDADEMAVLGIAEVLKRYGFFRQVFQRILKEVERRKPDAVLLVDYPGFNLRLAKQLHRRGIKVLYYVCPQVWAWNRRRIRQMAEWLDRLMVIFPFEVDVFKDTGLKVDFVGHPLVEEAQAVREGEVLDLPWPPGSPRIALMPGSRRQEIERHLGLMLDTAERLLEEDDQRSFLLAAASKKLAEAIEQELFARSDELRNHVQMVTGNTRHVLRQADLALVKSGTGTIETALQHCPMVILYKTSALTYIIGKLLVDLPYLGMVNIVAGRQICPEAIQSEATPEALSNTLSHLHHHPDQLEVMRRDLQDVATKLDRGRAAANVADIISHELELRPKGSARTL